VTTLTDLPRFTVLETLPADYLPVRRLEIDSRRTFALLNLLGLIPFFLGLLFFVAISILLNLLGLPPGPDILTEENRVTAAALTIIVTLIMLSVHELCHGLAFQALGARPRYGVNLRKFVAYASADGYFVTRDAYIIVALAPLVVISILTVLCLMLTGGGLRFIVALLGAANAGGAIGDLWFVLVCRRYPRDLLVRDFGEGAELYVRHEK
jgi:hypothetical protein